MKATFLRCIPGIAALALLVLPREAAAQLAMRTSVKFILSAGGTRPPGGALLTDEDVRRAFTNMNNLLDTFGRGYQFRITEIIDLAGHSELYNLTTSNASAMIKAVVDNDPSALGWRTNAANLYINNDPGGGSDFNGMVVVSHNGSYKTILHESGHHFGLCHTQGCGCRDCPTCELTDDEVGDTLPDRECWTVDDIATNAFHTLYANLNAAQRAMVSNTFNNVMSYHNDGTHGVLTSDQLDRMADTANGRVADNIITGFTRFVDHANTCSVPAGNSACLGGFTGPFRTLTQGVNAAVTGDIVLIRPGHYNEPMTLTKAVTLRATRGDALIGKP
jgi:hypothetical protein